MAQIVGLGQARMDYVGVVPRLPAFGGGSERLNAFAVSAGGSATTAMATAARLGAETALIAMVGKDRAGEELTTVLAQAGVQTDLVRVDDLGITQLAVVLVEEATGRRAVAASPGPEAGPAIDEPDRARIGGAAVLYVDGEHQKAALAAAHWAREQGVSVVYDARESPPGTEELVGLADYLLADGEFLTLFTALGDQDQAARRLLELGPSVVVAHSPENGAHTWTRREAFHTPPFALSASRVFHGAYVYGITRAWTLAYIADFAAGAAALAARVPGDTRGLPTLAEVQAFLADKGITSPTQ